MKDIHQPVGTVSPEAVKTHEKNINQYSNFTDFFS
jgi:hypothetical protein